MNRLCWRLCAVLCAALLLAGCGAPSAVSPITDGFTCRAAMQYGDMTVEGDLTCTREGGASLTFALPPSLQGITLVFNDSGMAMELGGMQLTVPADAVPQEALIRGLAAVLSATHPTGVLTDEGYVIRGETEGGTYTLVCDPASGLPRSLSIPSQQLEAVFTDVAAVT